MPPRKNASPGTAMHRLPQIGFGLVQVGQITTAATLRTKLFKDCFRFNQVEVVDAFVESGVHRI
jgi:hypothetical protein